MKKLILSVFIVICVLVFLYFSGISNVFTQKKILPLTCETVAIETGEISTTISGRGKLTTKRFSQVKSIGNKKIKKVLVKEGDVVDKDACLAIVEADAQYDLELHNARWGLVTNEQSIKQLTTKLENQEKLYEEGFIALMKVKETRRQIVQLETKKKILEKRISFFEKKLGKENGKSIDKNIDNNSSDMCIKAPFKGTVLRLYKQEGDTVMSSGQPLIEQDSSTILILADISEYFVEYKVSEIDLGKIQIGQTAKIFFDSFPGKSYKGIVDSISPVSSFSRNDQMGQQKDLSYYLTKIKIVDVGPELKQGLSCRVSIVTDLKKGILLAPIKALFKEDNMEYVFLVNKSTIIKKKVTTGLVNEDQFEITTSLSRGDSICVSPFIVMEQKELRRRKAERNWIEKIFN